jgi:hypothetical protein
MRKRLRVTGTMERKKSKTSACQERKSLYLEASRRDTQQKGGAHKLLPKNAYRAGNFNNKFERSRAISQSNFQFFRMTKPSLFSLHKRYRARKTADGDFVEETTLVDGKKVLGLDSKRGRPSMTKQFQHLKKEFGKE